MTPFGKGLVLVIFTASLCWVVWEIAVLIRDMVKARTRSTLSEKAKTCFAFLCWLLFFVVRNLAGWRAALVLMVIVSVLFPAFLLTLGFVHRPAVDWLISTFDSETYAEWAVGFLFAGMTFAWFAFLLFAPFGVLCVLGFRPCGAQ